MVGKGFPMSDGPFVQGLDLALQSFHVHRQQYHSGAFVGNHAHKSLQVSKHCTIIVLKLYPQFLCSLQMLTHCVSLFQTQHNSVPHHCSVILELYVKSTNKVFHKFANCHTLYNQGVLSQDEIKQLGTCKTMSLLTLLFIFPPVRLSQSFSRILTKSSKE